MVRGYYSENRQGMLQQPGMGLIHVAYGQGVGKTSRCIGLAVRASGAGLKVIWVQFMKGGDSSEATVLSSFANVQFRCPGKHPFILSRGPQSVHYEHAETALWFAKEAVKKGVDLLICDEILNTVIFNVLAEDQILELMDRSRQRTELVMSGADAGPRIRAGADYVTEFVQKKHPYYKGYVARKGIEY